MAAHPSGEPSWRWRRLVIFSVVGVAIWRLIVLEDNPDTTINLELVRGWLILVGLLVLGYTGLATVQDLLAMWRTGSALPYAPPPPPPADSQTGGQP
ncbi:hypothetical protein DFO45_2692 [Azorhizobium sp. AG788]|uniref:hypothetical protein n=1 Tax=Azorhizobium sp. AG788 TaxID=2183897 RepID=UPI001061007F|nr:hypothetical protein [Azorhizobium sp. AG788]TDT94934.1 hypothetical protein DFO45_2692 [Azorhizobium sp. AG788]